MGRIRYSKAELETLDSLPNAPGMLAPLLLGDADTYHAVAKGSSFDNTDSQTAMDSFAYRNNQQAYPGLQTRRYCMPGEFLRLSVGMTEPCKDVLCIGDAKALPDYDSSIYWHRWCALSELVLAPFDAMLS